MAASMKEPKKRSKSANVEVDDYLNQLIESGKGCNLTIYNSKPIKEPDDDEDDEYGP